MASRYIVEFVSGGKTVPVGVAAASAREAQELAREQLPAEQRKKATIKRVVYNGAEDMKPRVSKDAMGHIHITLPKGRISDGIRRTLARGDSPLRLLRTSGIKDLNPYEQGKADKKAGKDPRPPSNYGTEELKDYREGYREGIKDCAGDAGCDCGCKH